MKDITVFVVDDSSYMRAVIADIIGATDGMHCVGCAADPMEARQKIKETNPDVLTLDIEMPGMSGLEFLQKIMRLRPMPVIMVSSLTKKGADTTIAALSAGAADCVTKPAVAADMMAFRRDISEKIRIAATADIERQLPSRAATVMPVPSRKPSAIDLIAVGASTGGVEALEVLLPALGDAMPPVIVVQHMPSVFTASLAVRLNLACSAHVKEAEDGDTPQHGHIYIAQGGVQCRLVDERGNCRLRIGDTQRVSGHCPSVDALFYSAADMHHKHVAGVILTGMGSDGAQGLKRLRDAGNPTFGQDKATSLIYGMPRAAFAAGAVEQHIPLDRMADAIQQICL